MITWLNSYNCELINESDIAIFYRKNDNSITSSIIDLAFATQKLSENISDWYIDEFNASDSDHEIIRFNIRTKATKLVENSICSQFFNLKKADWKLFSEEILTQTKYIDFSHLNHSNNDDLNDLNAAAIKLQSIIYAAANKSIVKRKSSEKSKSWWSEKLTNLRKSYSFIRRKWKRNEASYIQFSLTRNLYFQEIKQAKQKCWNDFLENADSEQVFKVYKYCKQRKLEKTSIIQYNNNSATDFTEKCEVFLTALFSAASAASDNSDNKHINNLLLSSNFDENWPDLTEKELENAIFSSSTKSAVGSDKIDFLIIQKAYLFIS